MKQMIFTVLLTTFMEANSYTAQVEPYEKVLVLSEINGLVTKVKREAEYGFLGQRKSLVQVEKRVEAIEVKGLKSSLKFSKRAYSLKADNFSRKNKVRQISQYEKDLEKSSLYEIQSQMEELQKNIDLLEYRIDKKTFFLEQKYVGKIYVREGDYVDVGSKIMDSYDVSKEKIELYVRAKEIEGIQSKSIFINGKKSEYTIEKVSQVRDGVNLSSFLVRIVKKNFKPKRYFGTVVKVEFR